MPYKYSCTTLAYYGTQSYKFFFNIEIPRSWDVFEYIVVFNFHNVVYWRSASLGGFTYTTQSIFLFCKSTDFKSMDQHNHLGEAMIFYIKPILSLQHVGKSPKISELSSRNPLATSVALTFSSPLICFRKKQY